jgi:sterol 3beta-glucosyltransferase
MMDISVVASGSRGDVQPYVALGKGLKDAGYNVRILTSDSFEKLVTEAGLRFASTGESIEEILQTDEWRKVIESGNFLKILVKQRSEIMMRSGEMARLLPDLLKGSDLVVAGMAGMGGAFSVAEKLGIPVVLAYPFPFTPTTAFASPLVPGLPFGGIINRLSFHITRQVFWQTSKMPDSIIRQSLGMPKSSFWGPFRSLTQQQVPALYGYSEYVLPRPDDWASPNIVTGYWFLDAPSDWAPSSEMVDFLDSGSKPVYIGFGSMGNKNPEETTRLVLKALSLSGQRGVLASGWGGLSQSDLPETVHMISSAPHSWLFSQMAVVVHHGGAGTTAAGLRAGIPSIIIPFFGDQPFWGRCVVDLGVGPTPIPRKQLTAERLAQAITQAVSNTSMRQRASDLGAKIRTEDGIARAVEVIQNLGKPA